ncbi:MAG: hypothetical protein ACLRZH_13875 [Ruthenibacterium lactatiformans]
MHPVRDVYAAGRRHRPHPGADGRLRPPPHGETAAGYAQCGQHVQAPEGAYAGALIDQCGLRGYAIGGAQVSQKHCGFIVNTGNATCADVLCLADTVCKIVTDETGFRLEKEVRVVK